MNRIGLTTFHRSHNCGSILQAYAIQESIKEKGVSPEFINLSTVGQSQVYDTFTSLSLKNIKAFIKSLLKNTMGIILYNRLRSNASSYNNYIETHLNVSAGLYRTIEDIKKSKLSYDKYLTGSDQVWNVSIADYDESYFLSWIKDRPKIAYAVSQGGKNINRYAKNPHEIAGWIKDIDAVSTREENGQKWLKNLTGEDYPVVLDPTLLHDQGVYTKIEEAHGVPGIQPNKYIFVYATPLSNKYLGAIRKYAKENDLEVVIWHSDIWLKRLGWLKGIKCPKAQNPGKYLDLIKNAKFICTSSFHGVAFSTIYRKDFVVLENDGMRAGDDDRMTGFLKRLKLSDRIVDLDRFNTKMDETIDYSEFEVELKKNQDISHKFLSDALKIER